MKPFAVKGIVPWLVLVGLFAAAVVYVLAAGPGRNASRPAPVDTPVAPLFVKRRRDIVF